MILEDYESIARQALERANKAKTAIGVLWNLQIYAKAKKRIAALRAKAPGAFAGLVVPEYMPVEDL